nr:MAG TPA: hypothetical protein [Caudoviricetes sp.]
MVLHNALLFPVTSDIIRASMGLILNLVLLIFIKLKASNVIN